MYFFSRWFIHICLLCSGIVISINSYSQDRLPVTDLPTDRNIRTGKLKNGFSYYLVRDASIKNKVQLKVIIKTGFYNETPDEYSFAHLIEHAAFRETKNFKNI